uniref:Reverse transcriptase zinc-binding domain-containing protein n=1 Tax=Hordeum vulgare subsp. vulgare TaxID=112509 RepID=A0A8I6XRD0_HORVV
MMKFSKWAVNAINSQMTHFLWGNIGDQHKFHLANWGLVSRKKEFGGLGIPNVREYNMALLAYCGKRFFLNSSSDWKKVIAYKYNVSNPNIFWARQQICSPFWKSVSWALQAARNFYHWKIGNGANVRFWHDTWAGECSLKVKFWELFDICNQQECTVSQVWDGTSLRLSFRRCVDSRIMNDWENLIDHIRNYPLSDSPDTPVWLLEANGSYSVKSFYKCINFDGVVSPLGETLWKTLCPRKIHVFLWLCLYNKVLTRDNVAKRKTLDDNTCLFCNEVESVQHMFFDCVNSNLIWSVIFKFFKIHRVTCITDVSSFWKLNKKKSVLNMVIAASLWSTWKLRSGFCFEGRTWRGLSCNLAKLRGVLQRWEVLCGELLRIAWL